MDFYDLWALTACTEMHGKSLKLIASSISLVSLSMTMTSSSIAERCEKVKSDRVVNEVKKFKNDHND